MAQYLTPAVDLQRKNLEQEKSLNFDQKGHFADAERRTNLETRVFEKAHLAYHEMLSNEHHKGVDHLGHANRVQSFASSLKALQNHPCAAWWLEQWVYASTKDAYAAIEHYEIISKAVNLNNAKKQKVWDVYRTFRHDVFDKFDKYQDSPCRRSHYCSTSALDQCRSHHPALDHNIILTTNMILNLGGVVNAFKNCKLMKIKKDYGQFFQHMKELYRREKRDIVQYLAANGSTDLSASEREKVLLYQAEYDLYIKLLAGPKFLEVHALAWDKYIFGNLIKRLTPAKIVDWMPEQYEKVKLRQMKKAMPQNEIWPGQEWWEMCLNQSEEVVENATLEQEAEKQEAAKKPEGTKKEEGVRKEENRKEAFLGGLEPLKSASEIEECYDTLNDPEPLPQDEVELPETVSVSSPEPPQLPLLPFQSSSEELKPEPELNEQISERMQQRSHPQESIADLQHKLTELELKKIQIARLRNSSHQVSAIESDVKILKDQQNQVLAAIGKLQLTVEKAPTMDPNTAAQMQDLRNHCASFEGKIHDLETDQAERVNAHARELDGVGDVLAGLDQVLVENRETAKKMEEAWTAGAED